MQTDPINIYGKTKNKGEEAIRKITNKHIIVRTSWVFSSEGDNFVNTIIKLARKNDQLDIVDDQYGTPTNTEKVADFIMKILVSLPKKGIYHCAGREVMSWYDFAKKIVRENNYSNKVIPIESKSGMVKRPPYTPLKNTKI